MNTLKKAASGLLALLVLLALLSAGAAAAETGSISCDYILPGVTFRLYLVGRVTAQGSAPAGDFSEYPVDLTDTDAAVTLAAYALRDGLVPTAEDITDSGGHISFRGLEPGIYLLAGEQTVTETDICIPQPVLVQLPAGEDWDRLVNLKYERQPRTQSRCLSVRKLWAGTDARPEPIEVQLLRDGTVVDTVELRESNGWSHTWTELEGEAHWTVAEKNVPPGYTVTLTGEAGGYLLTNTWDGPPDTGDRGNFFWAAAMLSACAGMLWITGRRKR